MSNNSTISFGGIELLQVLLIVFKAAGLIGWAWWIVLLPTIISIGFGLVFLAIVIIVKKYFD